MALTIGRVEVCLVTQNPHSYIEFMETTGYLILFLYLAILVGIGVWCSRRQSSIQDFFVAGRSMPAWAALAAIVATETS
ncbi:hypothetical protein K8I31_12470, partial [bacterium]|nr:hypothetical protein [bacterium]